MSVGSALELAAAKAACVRREKAGPMQGDNTERTSARARQGLQCTCAAAKQQATARQINHLA